jgi:hypothetical protein
MGKRQIGQMEPSEFVVTMLIANLASIPMQDGGIPLFSGLVPILTVLGMELVLAWLSMRSVFFRKLLCGKPVILMENGHILQKNLRRTGITLDELVTGQQKTAAPPPPPYPSSPAPQRMSAKKIVGIALLVFAGLCLIVFTAVGFLIGAWFWGIVIALPCLLCGLICLLCEHNIGLKCAWAVYLLLWVLLTIVLMR